MTHTPAAYRPDVDGLRAVAVMSVLIYHAFPDWLPGGFVGVDIFFVISGYLITRILLGDLARGRFSLLDFYYRRVRRIFPALLLVLAGVLSFGWVTLLAGEYLQLGKHVGGGAAFIANLLLWSEANYFDAHGSTKPLLHLWSLAVEEQFYLVWPILLWVGWRWRSSIPWMILAISAASLALALWQTANDPTGAFYSPLTRFWELLAGAALAWLHMRTAPRAPSAGWLLSLTGAILLVCGFVWIRAWQFPWAWPLLPVGGAVALIAAGPRAPLNRWLLSNRLMVGLGLISYPLYLWHWPLLSFGRILHSDHMTISTRWLLLGLSVLLAWATWRFVERPIRAAGRPVVVVLLALMVLVGLGGLTVYRMHGVPARTVAQLNPDPLQEGHDGGWPSYAQDCAFLTPDQTGLFTCKTDVREPPRLALVGDSKAQSAFPGLFRTARRGGTWLYLGSGPKGPLVPIITDHPAYSGYHGPSVLSALDIVANDPAIDTVVLAMAMRALFQVQQGESTIRALPDSPLGEAALAGLDRTLALLASRGKQVVLLVDNPTLPDAKDCMGRRTASPLLDRLVAGPPHPDCQMPLAQYLSDARPYYELLRAAVARYPGQVRLFDATALFCDESTGICPHARNSRPLYGLTDHISDHASTLLGRALNDWLHPMRQEDPLPPVVVHDWGAREAVAGAGMNVQPDGQSALWIRTDHVDTFGPVHVRIGEHLMNAHISDTGLTTAVPPSVVNTPGEYPLDIVEASGRHTRVGVLRIVQP